MCDFARFFATRILFRVRVMWFRVQREALIETIHLDSDSDLKHCYLKYVSNG